MSSCSHHHQSPSWSLLLFVLPVLDGRPESQVGCEAHVAQRQVGHGRRVVVLEPASNGFTLVRVPVSSKHRVNHHVLNDNTTGPHFVVQAAVKRVPSEPDVTRSGALAQTRWTQAKQSCYMP